MDNDVLIELREQRKLEKQFNDDMVQYHYLRLEHGYDGKFAWDMINKLGGYKAAKRLIQGDVKKGLRNLISRNIQEYSVEALVVKPEYKKLFSDDEIEKCQKALRE